MVLPNRYGNVIFCGESYRVPRNVLVHARLSVPQTSCSCGLCDPARRVLTSGGGLGNLTHAVYWSTWINSYYHDTSDEPNVFDASFVTFRAFGLTYRLPARWSRRFSADAASVSLVGRNLWMWSEVEFIDPEAANPLTGYREDLQTPPARNLGKEKRELGFGPYGPNWDPGATMLGEAQWEWLARQLEVPAELRLIVSSVQVVSSEHGWEAWGQLPHGRQRLFELIQTKRANGVVSLSGDVHWGELSRYVDGSYPLYDFTSSALNQEWPKALNLPNPQRLGTTVYPYPNFGMVEIDWAGRDPTVHLRLHRENGEPVLAHRLRLSELRVG